MPAIEPHTLAWNDDREREPAKGELPLLPTKAGAGGRVTVRKGEDTAVIARIPMERIESAGIRARQACCWTRLFPGFLAGLEGFEQTSENRGVPGSSPGLAIQFEPAWRAPGFDAEALAHDAGKPSVFDRNSG